ncbi:MAG: type II secretion system protein GspD [Betaproteobacteria bacterium RIFCSPLOWO2_02_FULL_62_17]|nr:MAG: type II secretion system protein GspD [Betaproteobacteria bacterium RIFCSPLOWO2_02_FULL_62_17]
MVTLNFVNADIEGVVKAVSEITGRNFVIDPRVKGTVNIVSAKPMSRALIYQVFLSAMRLQGYAAIEERGMVIILPEAEAKMHRSPMLGPQEQSRAAGQTIQTQVFTLKHESAAQLVAVLRPLISPNNSITAYPGNNTLVITDYASNLQRIAQIIESVDRPTDSDSLVIALKYASALDVAQTISRLVAEPAQAADPTGRITIAADARSNSILARAGDPSRLRRVRELAAMLDTPTSAGGNIHVIYLKNAQAVKLAEVLRAIYSGEAGSSPATTQPAAPLGQAPAPVQSGASRPGIIQADAATNAIIITAPDAIYNNLRAAVEKLDVRRAQVYVEALIAEVTADKAAEFGIQWQNLTGLGQTSAQGFGGTNFGNASQNITSISQNPGAAGHGLNIGTVKGTITLPGVAGVQILNIGLLVRALQADSNANILSTPTLLTLDNEEAKIVIGQNVPFITGSYAVSAAATTPTPFQTIERKDVGLTLRIKPQISEGGAVRLQIFQEVSNVTDSTNVSGLITNKRSVESTVLVDDGQIVVIGGLIQDTFKDGVEKIPGLGDLPLIGGLFKYNTRSRSKTNLMVFLRPTLLRGAERADSLSSDRYDYILGEQLRAQPVPSVLPDFGSPSLPPRQSTPAAGAEKPAASQ